MLKWLKEQLELAVAKVKAKLSLMRIYKAAGMHSVSASNYIYGLFRITRIAQYCIRFTCFALEDKCEGHKISVNFTQTGGCRECIFACEIG